MLCCVLTLDRAVNQRCTRVNKWKYVGITKEYRQVPAAVESVGAQEGQSEDQLAD